MHYDTPPSVHCSLFTLKKNNLKNIPKSLCFGFLGLFETFVDILGKLW